MDGWVIFLLGLVLGLPLSIFANVATPWVVSYFKNRSLSSRQRKVVGIITRYERVAEYREDRTKLVVRLVMDLINILGLLFAFVVITFFDWTDDFVVKLVGVVMLMLVSLQQGSDGKLIKDVNEPNRYKESVINELSKLGYTLEEAQELKNKPR